MDMFLGNTLKDVVTGIDFIMRVKKRLSYLRWIPVERLNGH